MDDMKCINKIRERKSKKSTVRDTFASHALQGILAATDTTNMNFPGFDPDGDSKLAYRYADMMIKARGV